MISKLRIKLQDESNGTYQGFVNEQNQKEAFGVFLWDSGDFYIGEWKDNKINGQGIVYFNSGGYLEGYFSDSVVNGRALLAFPNQDKYFVNWKKGNLDGKVSMLFKASKKLFTTVYEDGQFRKIDSVKENVKELKTVNEFAQKCDINKLIQKYQNVPVQVRNNASENTQEQNYVEQLTFQKIAFNDGGFFIGITQNNIPSGLGLFQYSDQKFDCGLYKNGFLNGNGRKNFPIGDFYDGQFTQGRFEGEGIIYHKTQNIHYFGTFKDNILINEKQKGEGYPREILSQIKQRDHANGSNFTGDTVPSDCIKLSLLHNIQFLGNTGKQDSLNVLKSSSYQLQSQFISSAHSSSRNKDTTQKYHQKNLDTVYYLNQKIRAAQTPSNNSTASKENVRSKEGGTHRKNQTSLDFIRTNMDANFNSLQKIKNEYMTLPYSNGNNQSLQNQQQLLLIQQQPQQQNSSFKLKSENQEEIEDENQKLRNNSNTIRKSSMYLSPAARVTSTVQYNTLISPQSITTQNKKLLNSPQDRHVNKLNNIVINFNSNKSSQSKTLLKKELSPQPKLIGAQSPIDKAQKSVNQRITALKARTTNQVASKNVNNKSKGNVIGKQAVTTLIGQKSQPILNRVTSPDTSAKRRLNNLQSPTENSEQEVIYGDAIHRGSKTPVIQIDNSIDQDSMKEISADISRLKCDSQGDLLRENNNRSSQLSQQSLQKPKSSIATTNTLNKQKSYESKTFISGFNQQLNNTPQRQSHQSSSSNNQEKAKKVVTATIPATPFQTEEAMKHYYQTRIRKQLPDEILIKDDSIKNKQSALLSTKSCSSNSVNGSSSVASQLKQKLLTPSVGISQIKKKKDLLNPQNKNNKANQTLKNKLQNNQNSSQKISKGLISVKSQDNLINDGGCSFSSLQEQQQTLPDEHQKSKFSKIEQYQIEAGLTCFTQDDQDVLNQELDMIQNNAEDEQCIVNNENENCLNRQNNIQNRKSDCVTMNQTYKNDDIQGEQILLKKGFSAENNYCNNENVQNNNNQIESKNIRGTISDQIKHILSMQKNNNNSKHKFSMKPFILTGNSSKKVNLNSDNRQSENHTSSTKPQNTFKYEEHSLNSLAVQNPLSLTTQINTISRKQEAFSKKEDGEISPLEIPHGKMTGERHVLTPFHPTKSSQQKGVQSSNTSQSNKSQVNESIRSINQKMSSYLSFQERLNAIGQCIYKKDWNATQSLTSIRSLSRNSSTLVEKNQVSDDNINIMNPFSSDNINSKEEVSSSNQVILLQQQPQQNKNVSQLVVNYLQAQNNVADTNAQSIKDNTKEPINIILSDHNFDTNAESDKLDSSNNKIQQELLFDGIVQSNYNSLLQEEKAALQQFENNTLLHSSKQQDIQEIIKHNFCLEEFEKSPINNNEIEEKEKDKQNGEEMNFAILKTEEGEGDSVNKNDLACLQLKFNESDILNNKDDSEDSCDLNELQIDQKHFNEEDLLGINALEEVFSQNSESPCSFSPPKQDFNKQLQNNPQHQQRKINQRDLEDDLELQFDCQINLENLDIFTISQSPLNDNYIKNNNITNNKFGGIDDLDDLSPIKIKETDSFQQQQMITEFHFYEDLLLQQKIPNEILGNKNHNTFEENNCRYNQKYRPVLESIKENASEDQYTSPQKKQRSHDRQIFLNNEDLELIVTQIQF